jgi:hypothetical protein
MAEVAPSAGNGGGGNRNFLLIIGGLAALLFLGLLAFGAIVILPTLFGGSTNIAAVTPTPTRISIPPTPSRTPLPVATKVVGDVGAPTPTLGIGERRVLVEVGDNNAVTLTSLEGSKPPLVQKGTWSYEQGTRRLVLSLTEINGQPFKDEIILEVNGSQLVPISFNQALHGSLDQIQLERTTSSPVNQLVPKQDRTGGLALPAAQATATPQPLPGQYTGKLPAALPNQRVIALFLGPDNTAVLGTVEFGTNSVIQLGSWTANGNTVTVVLPLQEGVPLEVPDKLVFILNNDELVGTTYDKDLHGPSLILKRDTTSPVLASNPIAGTYIMIISLNATATPIAITATPILITATPQAGAITTKALPSSGLGEDLLLLFGGGVLLLGVIVVVRRMRST